MARTELLRSPQCPPVRSVRRSVGWRPPPGHAHACGCPLLQSFGLLCACAAAAHRLHPASTVFFSLGTISARALTRRLLAREVRADLQRIWAGRLSDDDWRRLARAAGGLWEAPLFINDTPGLSVAEIGAICRCLSDGRLGSEGEVRVPQESSSGGYGCDRATHVPSLQSLRRLAERGGVAALTLAPAWPEESKSRVASETTGISDLVRETVERTQEQERPPSPRSAHGGQGRLGGGRRRDLHAIPREESHGGHRQGSRSRRGPPRSRRARPRGSGCGPAARRRSQEGPTAWLAFADEHGRFEEAAVPNQ